MVVRSGKVLGHLYSSLGVPQGAQLDSCLIPFFISFINLEGRSGHSRMKVKVERPPLFNGVEKNEGLLRRRS